MDIHFFDTADEGHIRREKEKARELRRKQWWRQKVDQGICHYCGNKFPPEEITMDHIVPIARGGTSTKGNVVPACKECNNRKKYLLPLEWEEYLNGFKDKENIDDRQRDQS
ncbi:HNH endonuclease [Geovibrio thiophilus]|uniref:HNH endonuclease n=1 Tax=Geovibrio thiophilus TaxID=139438 RepID=A0A410K003_9BACT|nr:HNH endonuclease [Geovibrio thiophilus]QAR33750.1 HNH endonuclease [Geovibrio thiophilus]